MKALDNLGRIIKHFTKNNPPVVEIKETNYFSFSYFLAGAVLGGVAALLFTPDTGENNRRKIAEKFNELNDNGDDYGFSGRQTYALGDSSNENLENLEVTRENLSQI